MNGIFDISASGLTAERLRLDTIANNLANVETTRTPGGGPYRRQEVVFAPRTPGFLQILSLFNGGGISGGPVTPDQLGVRVVGIVEDNSPPRLTYDPSHPDANQEGYVAYPNVNVIKEMVDMISATRAYEANVTAMNETKLMFQRAMEIGRV